MATRASRPIDLDYHHPILHLQGRPASHFSNLPPTSLAHSFVCEEKSINESVAKWNERKFFIFMILKVERVLKEEKLIEFGLNL